MLRTATGRGTHAVLVSDCAPLTPGQKTRRSVL